MNLLIIEDDPNKAKNLEDFLIEGYPEHSIKLRHSYQSGLKALFEGDFNLVLLDMQLPTFDVKSGEDGHKFRKMAGVDILNEIKRKNRSSRVIIVTQFETFGEGEYFIDLNDLKKELKKNFPTLYVDTIFYDAKFSTWRELLRRTIDDITKEKNG